MRVGTLISFGAMAAAMAVASPAYAQAEAAPQSADDGVGNNDIIVTAQKRAENLVDVPISISVVSGEAIQNAGVTSVSGLQKLVPGLRFDNSGPYSQPTIRGIGSALSGTGLSANVATYVDGFYQSNSLSSDFDLFDLQAIQVLKGPQGTLFGRNATGGAIVVTTSVPDDELAVQAKLSYARFNDFRSGLFVSGGLAPDVVASLSLHYRRDDGFVRNIPTDDKKWAESERFAARAKVVVDASAATRFTLIGEIAEVSDPSAYAMSVYNGESTGVLFPGAIVPTGRRDIANDTPIKHRLHSRALYLKGEFDLGGVDLVSYSGYRRDRAREHYDIDASSANVLGAFWNQNDDVFTQELNLTSKPGGPLSWVAGAFYFHGKSNTPNFGITTGGSPFTPFFTAKVITDSYAAFLDGTYNLAPDLYLTVGGRYSYDRLKLGFTVAPTFTPDGARDSRSAFKPRGVLRYEFAPSSNIYASVSAGSKSAIFNANGQDKDPVLPENILAYEIGAKTRLDNWNIEVAAFRYDYDDLQVASYVGTASRIINAANARVYGAEFHAAGKLSDNFRVDLGLTYLDAKYLSFPASPHYLFTPATGVYVEPADASGNRMQRAPKFSGNVGLNYSAPLAGGELNINGNLSYQSKIFFGTFEERFQKGYAVVDARIGWTDPSGRWTIAGFAQNLTDTKYLASIIENNVGISQLFGRPATYGVELSLKI